MSIEVTGNASCNIGRLDVIRILGLRCDKTGIPYDQSMPAITLGQFLDHRLPRITAVRLKVEQNQLVGVFGEIGILFDALKGA